MSVRVCLIGAGRAGKVHANSLTQHVPRGALVALVDSVPETLESTGEQFGVPAAQRFQTLEAALEWNGFDAVVITTPTFTHKPLAVMAAQAGKHVFLEKPMALSLEECDAIIQAAETAGVVLQIGFMRRFDPEFAAAYERIQAGEIGQPMLVKSLTHGPGLPPPWARDLKQSNGMLAEVNSHDWDCTRWLMGSNPQRVYVEIASDDAIIPHASACPQHDAHRATMPTQPQWPDLTTKTPPAPTSATSWANSIPTIPTTDPDELAMAMDYLVDCIGWEDNRAVRNEAAFQLSELAYTLRGPILDLPPVASTNPWQEVKDGDPRLLMVFQDHYSYRRPKGKRKNNLVIGPGYKLALIIPNAQDPRHGRPQAIFAWRLERYRHDRDYGANCAFFRNESRFQPAT